MPEDKDNLNRPLTREEQIDIAEMLGELPLSESRKGYGLLPTIAKSLGAKRPETYREYLQFKNRYGPLGMKDVAAGALGAIGFPVSPVGMALGATTGIATQRMMDAPEVASSAAQYGLGRGAASVINKIPVTGIPSAVGKAAVAGIAGLASGEAGNVLANYLRKWQTGKGTPEEAGVMEPREKSTFERVLDTTIPAAIPLYHGLMLTNPRQKANQLIESLFDKIGVKKLKTDFFDAGVTGAEKEAEKVVAASQQAASTVPPGTKPAEIAVKRARIAEEEARLAQQLGREQRQKAFSDLREELTSGKAQGKHVQASNIDEAVANQELMFQEAIDKRKGDLDEMIAARDPGSVQDILDTKAEIRNLQRIKRWASNYTRRTGKQVNPFIETPEYKAAKAHFQKVDTAYDTLRTTAVDKQKERLLAQKHLEDQRELALLSSPGPMTKPTQVSSTLRDLVNLGPQYANEWREVVHYRKMLGAGGKQLPINQADAIQELYRLWKENGAPQAAKQYQSVFARDLVNAATALGETGEPTETLRRVYQNIGGVETMRSLFKTPGTSEAKAERLANDFNDAIEEINRKSPTIIRIPGALLFWSTKGRLGAAAAATAAAAYSTIHSVNLGTFIEKMLGDPRKFRDALRKISEHGLDNAMILDKRVRDVMNSVGGDPMVLPREGLEALQTLRNSVNRPRTSDKDKFMPDDKALSYEEMKKLLGR